MRKNKLLLGLILVFICSLSLVFIIPNVLAAGAESTSITVAAKTYEFDANNNYNFSSASEVSTMSYGRKQMGTLTLSGNITDTSTFKNKTAYGVVDDSVISFSYSYDGAYQTST